MTTINPAVSQSIAMINTMTTSMAPVVAMGSQYQTIAWQMGLAAMNQVFAQQQANISHQAAMVAGICKTYS